MTESALILAEDFGDEGWRTRWQIRDGTATAGNGELVLSGPSNAMAICLTPVDGDLRMEYGARIEAGQSQICDASCWLASSRERTWFGGYFFGFGSLGNTEVRLKRLGKIMAKEARPCLEPDHLYHVVGERKGATIRLVVDGREMLSWTDPEPLSGPDHRTLGFYVCGARARFSHLRVYRPQGGASSTESDH